MTSRDPVSASSDTSNVDDGGDASGNGRAPGSVREVFVAFLRLGLTSFGGPVAHLGYFRDEFVVRRRWLSDQAYADLVALCQFLPGPASSQVGMSLGLQRAGFRGMLAAWAAFTLPSAALLVSFALLVDQYGDLAGSGWLTGLKAAAVAVVAQAVLGMAQSLTPDRQRATIAAAAAIAALLVAGPFAQVAIIAATGAIGLAWLSRRSERNDEPASVTASQETAGTALEVRVPRKIAIASLVAFLALLAVLPLAAGHGGLHLFGIFYRAGALVFGGGHVVLPLLEAQTVATGLVNHDNFLAGYGAAQAVPGPLFTFSAFLGASTTEGPTGMVGAAIALVGIFLPAALLTVGALPFWQTLRHATWAQHALKGVNAGVVGLLAAALYDPVFTQGVTSTGALALAIAAFVALSKWRCPPWAVVVGAAVIGGLAL